MYPCLSQGEWVSPPGLFPTQVGLCGGWWSIGPMKNIHQSWLLLSKNPKDIYLTQKQKVTFPDSSLLNHCKIEN